jgi:hypothetical protein
MIEVRSTSTITDPCKRYANDVMQKSAPARNGRIKFGGVFNCRTVAGSTTFSQHAWGNAIDIFCDEDDLEAIAKNVVLQATKQTKANDGLMVPVGMIIHHQQVWTPNQGFHTVSSVEPHITHVHVQFLPEKVGTPPCV